jgi:hypothetical protein
MKKNFGLVMVVAALVALLLSSSSLFAYTVNGYVDNPGEYSTGGSLWTALQGTGTQGGAPDYLFPCAGGTDVPCIHLPNPPYVINSTNHNWVDSNYVLVTGKHGSRALYSVGELNPKFAPAGSEVTLTCASATKGRSCNKNGQCDLTGAGRVVKNVSSIDVVHAFTHIKSVAGNTAHPFSDVLIVSGAGITPRTYDLTDLQAMKEQVTFDASTSTVNTKGIWTGPTLLSVLKASGIDTKDMDSYIVVQATDGYATILSMYEATHKTGSQYALLAIIDEQGNTINCGTSCTKGDNGLARLVLPNDNVAGRWVSNVAQIMVYKLDHKEYCRDHHCF